MWYHPLRPQYFGHNPKFEIQAQYFFYPGPKVLKSVYIPPVGLKLREEIDFLKQAVFGLRSYSGG